MIEHISAVMITKDAEAHLQESLESLRDFKEVIIYDTGSQDQTLKIAQKFPNVTIHQGPFIGFGPTKNEAASLASNDWIFSIDSDEVVTPKLLATLQALSLQSQKVYAIHRQNLFLGRPIRHGNWGSDWVKRLYNRSFTRFSDAQVHESIIGKDIQKIPGHLLHYAVDEVQDFLLKAARYSKLPHPTPKKLHPVLAFGRALWTFLRSYIIRAGFLDGGAGLVISVSEFNGVFFKYIHGFYKDKDK